MRTLHDGIVLVIVALWQWKVLFRQADGASLRISPRGQQIKTIDSALALTCILNDLETNRGVTSLKWFGGPTMQQIEDTTGRVYMERVTTVVLRLHVTRIRASDAGRFSCVAQLDNGLTFADETRLSIYEEIKFADTPTFVRHDIGSSPILECRASGQPPPEISWRFNSRKITPDNDKYEENSIGLRINKLDLRDSGVYECWASVESPRVHKVHNITVDVLYPPVIRTGPVSGHVMQNKSFELTCDADGNPPVTYEWFRENQMSETIRVRVKLHSSVGRHVIKRMSSDDEGQYFCRVSNTLGEKEISVNVVMMVAPRVTDLTDRHVLQEGRTLVLLCSTSVGVPPANITWSRNNDWLSSSFWTGERLLSRMSEEGRGKSRLVLPDIQRQDSGRYSCTATNQAGTDTKETEVIVEHAPSLVVTSSTEQCGWPGQTRNFSCTANAYPLPHITWQRAGGQNLTDTLSVTYTIMTSKTSSGGDGVDVRDEKSVTSTLQIRISETHQSSPSSILYTSYMCIAKNQYGYMTENVYLKEAVTPDAPRNVTVLDEGQTWVTLSAERPKRDGGERVTGWLVTYERDASVTRGTMTSSVTHPVTRSLVFHEVGNITVTDLVPGTSYTFHLAAGNAVGFGKPIKFRVETPPHLPSSRNPAGKDVSQRNPVVTGPYKTGIEMGDSKWRLGEVKRFDDTQSDESSGNTDEMWLNAAGLGGLLVAVAVGVTTVLIAIITAVVCVAFSRQRRNGKTLTKGFPSPVDKYSSPCREGPGDAVYKGQTKELSNPSLLCTLERNIIPPDGISKGGSVPSLARSASNLAATSSRNNSHVTAMTSSPRLAHVELSSSRRCVDNCYTKSPSTVRRNINAATSLQRRAWESMLTSPPGTPEGGISGKVGGECPVDDRPLSISELPPPPAFLLDSDCSVVSCLAHDIQDGYRSGDSVDDDIDDVDYTIRAPSF